MNNLQEKMVKTKPDLVFHLAAQPLVSLSYEKPIETFQTNIIGTVKILECIRTIPSVRSCIILTSDKCYDNREIDYAYKEIDPMGGYDPYSASKGATELVTASYRNSFFNPIKIQQHKVSIATARAGNVIGGGDWAENRIVPDCIRALSKNQPIPVRQPNAIRPWQHVLEPVSGILCLALRMWKQPAKYAEPWNFGPATTNRTTVKELVDGLIQEWGNGEWKDESKEHPDKFHEAGYLMLDSSKAINTLDWHPVYNIKEAILETVNWYRAYIHKTISMKEITLLQIKNYLERARKMNIGWTRENYN